MSLEQWDRNGWIIRIQPAKQTVASQLGIADREIADGALAGISPDGRFDHAYGAVRALCVAALHACGYGLPKSGRTHERVIESLRLTLGGKWAKETDFFDRARRMRHQTLYDSAGIIQDADASDLLGAAMKLRAGLEAWLKANHPNLVD